MQVFLQIPNPVNDAEILAPESYYPVVPAVVGTTSNSDMTGFEASGGCCGKGG